jgi:serine protease Do
MTNSLDKLNLFQLLLPSSGKLTSLNLLLTLLLLSATTQAQFSKLVAAKEKAIFQIQTFTEFGLQEASGTGFFIDKQGTGITALHVLEDARFAFIKDNEGHKYPIEKIIGISEKSDLVQFKVNTSGQEVPFLNVNQSLPVKGAEVFTIGNPQGFSSTVSKGIVSSLIKKRGIDIIQTTVPISQGSSGGPLMDLKGRVIGVISYFMDGAQNLNFAYSIDCINILTRPHSDDAIYGFGKGVYLLNRSADKDQKLTLHTIDKTDSSTTAYFSYSNFSIAFGDGAFIYSNIDDTTVSMFILDPKTGKKLYATGTTLGKSVESPTTMKIGETVYFKIVFPPIGSLKSFDIGEGMKGGSWTFSNIQMPSRPVRSSIELDKFYQDDLHLIILQFNNEDFDYALETIEDMRDKKVSAEKLHMMEATAHFALNNTEKAIAFISAAQLSNPDHSDYHADLYALNLQLGRNEEALHNINNAIKCNDQYIEYFNMRAEVHLQMEHWKLAIDDLTKYIESGRELSSYLFKMRAEAKTKIKDDTACMDFAKAKELASSDREWEKINLQSKLYCK